LRRCTKLDDIETLIDDMQKKSMGLLTDAEKKITELTEE